MEQRSDASYVPTSSLFLGSMRKSACRSLPNNRDLEQLTAASSFCLTTAVTWPVSSSNDDLTIAKSNGPQYTLPVGLDAGARSSKPIYSYPVPTFPHLRHSLMCLIIVWLAPSPEGLAAILLLPPSLGSHAEMWYKRNDQNEQRLAWTSKQLQTFSCPMLIEYCLWGSVDG